MKLPHSFAFGLSVLALSMSAFAADVHAPKPDPLQGDGRVSAFYTWEKAIPAAPGKLLRSEPLDSTLSLANAASAQRKAMVFRSFGDLRQRFKASGSQRVCVNVSR
jgi:hypothetical protein